MSRPTKGQKTTEAARVNLHGISVDSPSASEVRELIARRAYELYKLRAPEVGDEMSDWLQAEGEIVATLLGERPETSETNIPGDRLTKRSPRATRTAKPAKEPQQRVTRRPKRNNTLIGNPA